MADAQQAAAPPTFLGMVVCDNILQDPESKKYYLMGTASTIGSRAFPVQYGQMCVYVALTEIHQHTRVSVKLVFIDRSSGQDRQLVSLEGEVNAPNPLAVAELSLKLRNLVLPQPGEYRFQLWSGQTLLGERKFFVRQIEPNQQR